MFCNFQYEGYNKMFNFNFIVYFIGVVIFAIFYEPVKQALGGGLLFFISAIAYLVSLRALGYLLENRFKQPENMNKE
jgi:predicted Na+-dependent transporter